MQIQFALNGKVVTARLEDSPATRDFLAMLPMTVTLKTTLRRRRSLTCPGG